jgi:hypothetical protein
MPNQTGGYAFEHSISRGGGDRGVLTENERRTLEKERRAAQIPAEAAAASAMQASVDAILNGGLSTDAKRYAISRLQPSGVSPREFEIWKDDARTSVGLPPHV